MFSIRLWITHAVGINDCELAGDSGKKDICFGGHMISGLTTSDAHVDLKVDDMSFHDGSYLMLRTLENVGIEKIFWRT